MLPRASCRAASIRVRQRREHRRRWACQRGDERPSMAFCFLARQEPSAAPPKAAHRMAHASSNPASVGLQIVRALQPLVEPPQRAKEQRRHDREEEYRRARRIADVVEHERGEPLGHPRARASLRPANGAAVRGQRCRARAAPRASGARQFAHEIADVGSADFSRFRFSRGLRLSPLSPRAGLVRAGAMAPGSPLRNGRAGSPEREGSPNAARPPIGHKSRLKRMTKIYGIDKSTAALLQASYLRPCCWLSASLGLWWRRAAAESASTARSLVPSARAAAAALHISFSCRRARSRCAV